MKNILVLMALLLSGMLAGCMGYVPGQQSYWDAQVRAMCGKDGGVRIFEQIVVSPSEASLLPKVGDFFGVVSEALAKSEEPGFTRMKRTVIRESNPSVIRYEEEIVRRFDQRVVGVVVSYGRGGGDFPSPAHPSNYHCPTYKQLYEGIHEVYRIEGAK